MTGRRFLAISFRMLARIDVAWALDSGVCISGHGSLVSGDFVCVWDVILWAVLWDLAACTRDD